MAIANSTTGLRAPVSVPVSVDFDSFAHLAEAYDALQVLAMAEDGHSSPVSIVLGALNRQFRALVDDLDARGLLS